MNQAIHQHDLTERQWALPKPHLPGRADNWGGVAQDNRRFINAVLRVFHTAP